MSTFTIRYDDLEPYLRAGQSINPIVERAREAINGGGQFIIQDGIAPGRDLEISSHEELNSLLEQLDPVKLLPQDEDRFFLFQGRQLICEAFDVNVSGGNRRVTFTQTMGGPVRNLGRPTPTRVQFTCNHTLSLELLKPYTLLNYEYEGMSFAVESVRHQNGRTIISGVKTEN